MEKRFELLLELLQEFDISYDEYPLYDDNDFIKGHALRLADWTAINVLTEHDKWLNKVINTNTVILK